MVLTLVPGELLHRGTPIVHDGNTSHALRASTRFASCLGRAGSLVAWCSLLAAVPESLQVVEEQVSAPDVVEEHASALAAVLPLAVVSPAVASPAVAWGNASGARRSTRPFSLAPIFAAIWLHLWHS